MHLRELGLPESLKAGPIVPMERVIIAHTLCTKVNCSQAPVHTHVHRNKNHVKFKNVNLHAYYRERGERERERERCLFVRRCIII